jgi:His-Xaa-Ser system radical SAM maturase HxsC
MPGHGPRIRSPMRRVNARQIGFAHRTICNVASVHSLAADWRPNLSYLVRLENGDDVLSFHRLYAAGISQLCALVPSSELAAAVAGPVVIASHEALETNDVVAVTPGRGQVQILYRERDQHHTVFLTNRCNSNCVMCSQPPTRHDDSWLVQEAHQIAQHIVGNPACIGFTGGEPLLLGTRLAEVLRTFDAHLPRARLEVLTNGRALSDRAFAVKVLSRVPTHTSWMVPLYGHADFLHDDVVRCEGAFDETVGGLLNLQSFSQMIQLRIVLIKPVLENLEELCRFIARNLPFVREVALIGCEPTGLALANREACEVDIRSWMSTLQHAAHILHQSSLPVVLMNIPLCALPEELRSLAHRSISDWKQTYAPECAKCGVREDCCGLFAWHAHGWRPTHLQPIFHDVHA